MNLTVVDSIMGSGKSTWARKYMNEHPEKRWWYVTTYIEEVEKTLQLCQNINMRQPEENAVRQGSSKSEHLLRLIDEGANIAMTHALFLLIEQTPELLEQIRSKGYCIIFDEVPNVVDSYIITRNDIAIYSRAGTFSIDTEGKLTWLDYDYSGTVEFLIPLTKTGTLYQPEEGSSSLVWLYNPSIFNTFDDIYILTYFFIGSRMYHYLKWYGYEFSFVQTNGETLVEHDDRIMEIKRNYEQLIHIEDSNLNDIGTVGLYASKKLSSNWYDQRKNDESMDQLFKNTYNFFHNKCHAHVKDCLYTTFKRIADNDPLFGYKGAFLSCTTTSSNAYDDKKYLAYLVNVFENPAVRNFFSTREIAYNEDVYARNAMIQWIWRSCIRKNPPEPIWIYIPSVRMRELLINWFTMPE